MNKSEPGRNLHAVLGRAFSLAVVLGSTIGVGILRMPGEIAAQIRDFRLVLLLWLTGGIYSLLACLSFAELAARNPQAGGPYVYIGRAFGERVGFAVGWADWLSFCSVLALLVNVVAEYSVILFPRLGHQKLIAVFILCFFVALNWLGIQISRMVQQLSSFLKLLAFLVLVAGCLLFGGQWPAAGAQAGVASLSLSFTIAVQMVVSTYAGWHAAVYFVEESRNPSRDVPRSMLAGIVIVTIVYLLINIALIRVLPLSKLAGSDLPAADAATAIAGTMGGTAILLLCLWSLLSVVNVYLLSSTRIFYALGRDHHWGKFSAVNRQGTPVYVLLGNSAVALLLVLTRSFEKLVALAAFILLIVYCASLLAHIVTRWREGAPRYSFKAWGYPWTTGIALLLSIAILASMAASDPRNSILSLILLLGTYTGYRFGVARIAHLLRARPRAADEPASVA